MSAMSSEGIAGNLSDRIVSSVPIICVRSVAILVLIAKISHDNRVDSAVSAEGLKVHQAIWIGSTPCKLDCPAQLSHQQTVSCVSSRRGRDECVVDMRH